MPETLLRTKLFFPPVRPELVHRPQLIERLNQGLQLGHRLTLISAPAGFGKTTLLAASLTHADLPVAWLSVDSDDNQPDRFLSYLVAALQEANHTVGKEAEQLLSSVNQAPLEAIMTSLINDLDATGDHIVLVLDDYQFISNQAVHDSVTFLLEHCPKGFHLLLATRSDPPLPVARLRASGQAVELRADQLRFSRAEVAQFLNEVMDLCLDAESVAALEERTEGWIAGLQMAAISMRDRKDIAGFIDGFSGTNRFILDYLVEEVLDSLPPHIQVFLLYTSILNRLAAPLCDSILTTIERPELDHAMMPGSESIPGGQSASILDYLERSNLFLIPLDDDRIWYRYHHLFADLLRARLYQAHPDLVSILHFRASAWLEQNGSIDEAIYHLLTAKEIDRAADLIEHYGPIFLAENDPSILYMAESLPQDKILTRPKFALYLAWLLIIQGRIPKALPLLNGLAQQPSILKPDSEQRWMQAVVASALAFLAPPATVSEQAPLPDFQLFDEIPAGELALRNAAEFLYTMALGRRGELERAAEIALKCVERERKLLRTQAIPTLAPFLTRIYLIIGRLHEAASLCYEFLKPITEKNFQFLHATGAMKIDLGEVLYEWNHLEEAEQNVRDGLHDNATWQNIMTDGFGLVALARILMAKGDYSGALRVVTEFETKLQEKSQPREFIEDLRTLRVRVQLANGDLENPSRWADEIELREASQRDGEIYRITMAKIRLAQGRYAETEQLLTNVAHPIAAGSQVSRQLCSDLLRAVAIAKQGRLQEALIVLDTCLATAQPEGYVRVFLDVGEAARELLVAYLRSSAPGHELFARKILDAFPLTSQGASHDLQTAVLIEPLTKREIEVLELIALGRTNKEIAEQLIVAPGTVKAHTASIYRKLDVTNRTEAAVRAREIGILS